MNNTLSHASHAPSLPYRAPEALSDGLPTKKVPRHQYPCLDGIFVPLFRQLPPNTPSVTLYHSIKTVYFGKNSAYFKKSKPYFLKSKAYFFKNVNNYQFDNLSWILKIMFSFTTWRIWWRGCEGDHSPQKAHRQRNVKGWRGFWEKKPCKGIHATNRHAA